MPKIPGLSVGIVFLVNVLIPSRFCYFYYSFKQEQLMEKQTFIARLTYVLIQIVPQVSNFYPLKIVGWVGKNRKKG